MEQREPTTFPRPLKREDAQGPRTPFALEYASPKSAVEASTKAIESRRRGARSEIADLQRCAIAVARGMRDRDISPNERASYDPTSSNRRQSVF